MLRKGKMYLLSREKREEVREFVKEQLRVHQTLKVTSNNTYILCREEGWKKENGTRLSIPE